MSDETRNGNDTERRGDYRVLTTMLNGFEQRQALRDEMHNKEIAGIRSDMKTGFESIERRERKCSEDLWREVNVAKSAVPDHVEAYHTTGASLKTIRAIIGIIVGAIAVLSFVKLFVLGG
jgi:hypothetical protein